MSQVRSIFRHTGQICHARHNRTGSWGRYRRYASRTRPVDPRSARVRKASQSSGSGRIKAWLCLRHNATPQETGKEAADRRRRSDEIRRRHVCRPAPRANMKNNRCARQLNVKNETWLSPMNSLNTNAAACGVAYNRTVTTPSKRARQRAETHPVLQRSNSPPMSRHVSVPKE